MLDRVWQSICEGDAECLGLKPDQVFSRHEIPLVVPMLCLTFEDIIQAFATFHDSNGLLGIRTLFTIPCIHLVDRV